MKLLLLASALTVMAGTVVAQDQNLQDIKGTATRKLEIDTSHKDGWRKGVVGTLSLGQGNSNNWAAGAETSSFSIAATVGLFANKKWAERWTWSNRLDLGYALQKTSSQGSRKTDDKIDFFTKIGYKFRPKWSFSGILNFRSQFTDGFDYDYLGEGFKRRISGFMAPAYVTVAPGIDWEPAPYFTVFMTPISARWILVTSDPYSYYFPDGIIPPANGGGQETPLATQYGVDPVRKVNLQAGAYLSANFNKEIIKNVTFTSRLDLYSNYLKPSIPDANGERKAKPQNVDVFWTNVILMKVNKFLTVTYNFDMIYDDDVRQFGPDGTSPGLQTRSLLGVGVTAKF